MKQILFIFFANSLMVSLFFTCITFAVATSKYLWLVDTIIRLEGELRAIIN
jgi:hypothetical protein